MNPGFDKNFDLIREAAKAIRQGKLVAFPTETVYGLGADAFNPRAVARIFEVKGRPRFDPLIVHIAEVGELDRIVEEMNSFAYQLVEAFWPGPLTLVLPKKDAVPDIVTAGLPTVAVRMPSHPVASRLIELAGRPIAAPSANIFGMLSPTTAQHVHKQLGDKVDLILDGGPCHFGLESTVISLVDARRPYVLRAGAVPVEDIEKLVGAVKIGRIEDGAAPSPGMLLRHYSPRTPLKILDAQQDMPQGGDLRVGLLAFRSPQNRSCYKAVEVLSEKGDLREAAANLFAALHRLDEAGLDLILAERVPRTGLGLAIMDRIERAAALRDSSKGS